MNIKNPLKIIIFGPQASGKGTQAGLLSKELNIPQVCSGDLLRDEIKAGSELGKQVKEYVNSGELVPEELVRQLVKNRLDQSDVKDGFIIDGYPRSKDQAEFLNSIVEIDKALLIDVSKKEVMNRITSRRICSECGEIYNLIFNKSEKKGICDKCGKNLIQRDDEKPEIIEKRLSIYEKQTTPMLSLYEDKGLLIKINGEQSIEDVYQEVKNKLNI